MADEKAAGEEPVVEDPKEIDKPVEVEGPTQTQNGEPL